MDRRSFFKQITLVGGLIVAKPIISKAKQYVPLGKQSITGTVNVADKQPLLSTVVADEWSQFLKTFEQAELFLIHNADITEMNWRVKGREGYLCYIKKLPEEEVEMEVCNIDGVDKVFVSRFGEMRDLGKGPVLCKDINIFNLDELPNEYVSEADMRRFNIRGS